ncbi:MAG: hypothetical protein IJV71_05825 [Lachnospiraceae bacterium]|nr:hypothetical protein [Lachnospiraceae bacterium]
MEWKEACRLRLLWDFQGSFFNERDEFIAHRYSNTYFIFGNCETKEDVDCKVLEWLSRSASKGIPYNQEWRNKKFRQFMLNGINQYLNTNFSFEDMEIIYTYLGNACNHKRTLEFIKSGFDMSIFSGLN